MSKFPTKPQYTIPKGEEELDGDSLEDLVSAAYNAVGGFMKTRSFRRIYMIAGLGGAIFAAWYLFQKYTDGRNALPAPLHTIETGEELQKVVIHRDHDHLVQAPPVDEKVVIHSAPRGFFTPFISTGHLQLETFLRVANIPYEVNFTEPNDASGPFMSLGRKMGHDFRDCVRILGEKYETDLEKDASPSRKTASHLIDVLLENQFSWAILIWRYIFDQGRSLPRIQPVSYLSDVVVEEVAMQIMEATKYHPIGQLSEEEFTQKIFQGLQDISAALGKHHYFLGSTPGIVDCHAFAILAQIMWNMPASPFETQLRRYSNLVDYLKRMKETYWPDWNQLIYKPDEYDATEARLFRDRSLSVSERPSDEKMKRKKTHKNREPHQPPTSLFRSNIPIATDSQPTHV